MAEVRLKIPIQQIDEVLERFSHVKVYRSATSDGTFVEISDTSTRPLLKSGQLIYEFVDTAGSEPPLWYKTAFYNSGTGDESQQSDAVQGIVEPRPFANDPALSVFSIDEFKEIYLFGVDLTDSQGNQMPDRTIIHQIRSAVTYVSNYLNLALLPETIVGEKLDFIYQDYYRWNHMKLLRRPIQAVTKVELILPPNSVAVSITDTDYFKFDSLGGRLEVVPTASQLVMVGVQIYQPILTFSGTRVPQVHSVDYTAGYPAGEIPADIKDAVGRMAAIGVLNIAGDLAFGPGLVQEQVKLDGAETSFRTTQSATAGAYGARISNYKKELQEILPRLRGFYTGVKMAII